jgi:AcrR family transcriptional regulator
VVKRKRARKAGRRGRTGDPERSTDLLWGAGGPSGRRRKAGLSLDRIVRTAIELADAEGLTAVSMRRIAQRLGFTTMSLYRHLPGKEELTDLMRDRVIGEVAGPDREPRTWRMALEAWARRGWSIHQRHPWLAVMSASQRVPGPNAIAHYEGALRAVAGSGLEPAERIAVVALVGGFVESTARQAVETARTEQATGVTEAEWWGARGSLFEKLGDHPALESVWRSGGYDRPLDPFDFGLQRILDGVERLVPSR